jgi:stearoyl-CoA desaturase (delta-9 desaturase)
MTLANKIKSILIFNHVALILGLVFASPWWLLLTIAGWIAFGKFGGEIGLHRYLSHKSFTMAPWKARLLLILGIFNCFGSPLLWAGTHRKHHAKSDTIDDPIGPKHRMRLWTKWNPPPTEIKYSRDLVRNMDIGFIHRHYFKLLLCTYVVLVLIDWRIPVFLISISSVMSFHTLSLVNGLCHQYGYRNFETADSSTNLTWVNAISLGSGLHNNHHHAPNAWTTKVLPGEWDLMGWFIYHFLMVRAK